MRYFHLRTISSAWSSTLKLFASVRGVDAIVRGRRNRIFNRTGGRWCYVCTGKLESQCKGLLNGRELVLCILTLLGVESLAWVCWLRDSTSVKRCNISGCVCVYYLASNAKLPGTLRTMLAIVTVIRIGLPLAAIASEALAQHVVDARAASADLH